MSGPSPGRRDRWLRSRGAEGLCALALRLAGWRILARNWRPARGTGAGEVDIIARRGAVLAFIEVKARPDLSTGLAAVTPHQRRRVIRAAEVFLQQSPLTEGCQPRFDVMVVSPWRWPHHLPDAWSADAAGPGAGW